MDISNILNHLDSVIKTGEEAIKQFPHETLKSNRNQAQEHQVVVGAVTAISSALHKFQPHDGEYKKQADSLIERYGVINSYVVPPLVGIVKSLKWEMEQGYLKTLGELFHGEIFSDFLDMSQHLLTQHYKDAAAVIAGGTLEGHLRKLCQKYGIALIKPNGEPKSLDVMNSDLVKKSAYSLTQQKAITAWADIRNNAAHAHYDKYDEAMVSNMILGIRNFLVSCPA